MNILAISPYVFGEKYGLTWYSVCVLVGAILTYIISNFIYKKDPESKKCPDLIFNTFLIAFPSGLVGARLWFVLSELEYYMNDPMAILRMWEGGLAIQGGVILGAAVGIWYAIHKMRKHGMNLKITTLMDMIIPNILIAQVVGRWGNFFNREVYGACVEKDKLWFLPSFILDYMRGGTVSGEYIACSVNKYAQPLFLYEGILNFIGFILITVILRKYFTKRVDGTLSAFYLIWYGTVRVSLEGLRNEIFIMRWGEVSQSVVTSIVYIILGVGFIIGLYLNQYLKNKLPLVNEKLEKNTEEMLEELDSIIESNHLSLEKELAEIKKELDEVKKSYNSTRKSSTKSNTTKKTTTRKNNSTKKVSTTKKVKKTDE